MKAKSKPLETLQLADLGVESAHTHKTTHYPPPATRSKGVLAKDAADTHKTTHYAPPAKRSKGVMVKDAAELVVALKQKGLL